MAASNSRKRSKHLSETRTEDLILDLLKIQGWPTNRPPKGCLVRQNEYKSNPELEAIFKGKSKSGTGDAFPDFLLIDSDTMRPQMIIEAKADESAIDAANDEALHYAKACHEAGHPVLSVGVAGQERTSIVIGVKKYDGAKWVAVEYDGNAISWIPRPDDAAQLVSIDELIDLAPVVPDPEVLAEQADYINRTLREAHIKDEYRPAYVGAMMLALWQSRGKVRKDPDFVLGDINRSCQQAFARGGKPELAQSLRVDEANTQLANSAWKILSTLEKLNVVAASFAHDYLGQLYETFFRYTGGNTIGQYFTPRHIARFMADICETTINDVVIDPACGTGGFLIACMQRAYDESHATYEDAVDMIHNKLIGYESEPVTAALCVANMILRGDGKTGIRKEDCFKAPDFPEGLCQVSMMNPPFPHKKTDVPPQHYVERALEALEQRGKLAVILPTSLLVKKDIAAWRKKILTNNTLVAVCQLPDELFQPYASATTSIAVFEKGVPHTPGKTAMFVRLRYDGLALKKSTRIIRLDGKNDIPSAITAIHDRIATPGFAGSGAVYPGAEWSPGLYIPSAIPTQDELKVSIDELLRRLASFYVRYASEVANLRMKVNGGSLAVYPYRQLLGKKRLENAAKLPNAPGTIGQFFDIYYGQKELHSRDGMEPGDALVVSPTEEYNGCYGWLAFEPLIKAPFVTVAQTGTIGEAFVQLEPCGVNDDCLILLPKAGDEDEEFPLSRLVIAAAIINVSSG